jgi:hypothetical protein
MNFAPPKRFMLFRNFLNPPSSRDSEQDSDCFEEILASYCQKYEINRQLEIEPEKGSKRNGDEPHKDNVYYEDEFGIPASS